MFSAFVTVAFIADHGRIHHRLVDEDAANRWRHARSDIYDGLEMLLLRSEQAAREHILYEHCSEREAAREQHAQSDQQLDT